MEGDECQRCRHIQICSTPNLCRPTPETIYLFIYSKYLFLCLYILASQDAPEVMGVSEETLADFTDVTLVSEDTNEDDEVIKVIL